MTDLQLLYETSRMEEYFDWDYTVYRCLTREMKRRIPWLYPGDGMIFHDYISLRAKRIVLPTKFCREIKDKYPVDSL